MGNESYFDKRTQKRYLKSKLQISGYKNVRMWVNLIGSSNLKHIKKMWECGDLNSVIIPTENNLPGHLGLQPSALTRPQPK